MAFGNSLDDGDEVMSEINMTPLVDVMLVLLIIFIIAMPVITHSVNIDLPQASHEVNQPQPQAISITVAEFGEIHWDNESVSAAELKQRLSEIAQHQPQPAVHLRGDRRVEYEHVVQVLTAVQQAGISQLGFVTNPAAP